MRLYEHDPLPSIVLAVYRQGTDDCLINIEASPVGPSGLPVQTRFDKAMLAASPHAVWRTPGDLQGEREAVRRYGDQLFRQLMVGRVGELYRRSRDLAQQQQCSLIVNLRITDPVLAAVPWEYLYDTESDNWLAACEGIALVRSVTIEAPFSPVPLQRPLRVLVATAQPRDLDPIGVQTEVDRIITALSGEAHLPRDIQVDVLEHARLESLRARLTEVLPHVLHFVGHGAGAHGIEHGFLMLEDEAGDARATSADELASVFEGIGGPGTTRLAVLSACRAGMLSPGEPFAALAPFLLRRCLSAVVAMQSDITVDAAASFTSELYTRLAAGRSLEQAVTAARSKLRMYYGLQSPYWAAPVLYLRAGQGNVFRLVPTYEDGLGIPPLAPPSPPPVGPTFVGRGAELASLAAELDSDGFVALVGAPRVGKSELATRLVMQAAPNFERVFWYEFAEEPDARAFASQLAHFLAWYGEDALWRSLYTGSGKEQPPSIAQQFALVQRLLPGHRFVLFLENFHLAQKGAVIERFIGQLIPRLAELDLRLVITSRQGLDPGWPKSGTHIAGLDVQAVRAYLDIKGISAGDQQVHLLYELIGGNPQLLIIVANALRSGNKIERDVDMIVNTDLDIQRYLQTYVRDVLRPDENRVMMAIAVHMGIPVPRQAIEATLGGARCSDDLLSLMNKDLLKFRQTKSGREYSQTPVIRAFYYEELDSSGMLKEYHHRTARYFETTANNTWLAAAHCGRADEYRQAALLVLDHADQAVLQGGMQEVDSLLDKLMQQRLDRQLQVRLRLARGRTAAVLRGWNAAIEQLQPALSLAAGDTYYRSFVHYRLAQASLMLGAAEDAGKNFKAGIELLAAAQPTAGVRRLQARLHIGLAVLRVQYWSNARAAKRSLEAAQAFADSDEDALQAQLASAWASYWQHVGQLDKAVTHAKAAWLLVATMPPGEPRFATAYNFACLLLDTGQRESLREAGEVLAEALATSEALGQVQWQAMCWQTQGAILFQFGETEQAISAYLAAYRVFSERKARQHLADSCYNLAESYAALHQCNAASDYFRQALELAGQLPAPALELDLRKLALLYPDCLHRED